MKKFISFIFVFITIFCTISFFGCQKKEPLLNQISELRCDLFEGSSPNYTIKASYGFMEEPYVIDGSVGEKNYLLRFKICNLISDNSTYTLIFNYNDNEYKENFKRNDVTGSLTVNLFIEDFKEKNFTIKIMTGSNVDEIQLSSVIPQNTISYQSAITHFKNQQSDLIKNYTTGEVYDFEIYLRVIVKDEKPYWYIGLGFKDGTLKALLIDGFNGEILAIREII